MEKKKSIILTVIASVTLVALVIGATYAYFQATGGIDTSADVKVTTYTSDLLTFEVGKDIAIYADQSNFAEDTGNQSGASFAKTHLLANNKTNTATANYYVYLYIADNYFVYTQDDNTPELLLQVTNPDGVEVTSLSGLEYKTVTDGKGNTVKGFDITTKSGMLTLVDNHEINATPETQETWNINVVFVNLNADQNKNTGKSFSGQVIITKENYDNYTPAMVHTIQTTVENSNLTVEVNASEGTSGIDKYYFALKKSNAVAMDTSKVTRLSNKLAVNNLEYFESDTNSYTFTNISANSNYEIYTYVIDNKKTSSNLYNSKINQSVVLPSITNVEVTNKTETSITVSVTASAGTNALNKYYYSIDNGNTYVESSDSTYTLSNLISGTKYNIKVKVSDINNNYSYEYGMILRGGFTLTEWVGSQYTGTQGENNLYYHNGTITDDNGTVLDAGDNSYRYAGSSDTTNNFVCFGSDEKICPDDNLYRIIGVFEDQVKLIKWDYANSDLLGKNGDYNLACSDDNSCKNAIDKNFYKGSNVVNDIGIYWWNNDGTTYGTNAWNSSKLNLINLNKNYLNKIGSTWTNKIATTDWIVGGNTFDNIIKTSSITYKNEVINPAENTTYSAKVALMYISDYTYAAAPILWTSNLGSVLYSSSVQTDDWMYMGIVEWTVVRRSDTTFCAFVIDYSGRVYNNYVGNNDYNVGAIRPVFYLNSSVTYVSGAGTKENPIIIN